MAKRINLIILGVNYFGEMASTQRVRNLFESLLKVNDIRISNVTINNKNISNYQSSISLKQYYYNYLNPFSILVFLFSSSYYCLKNFEKKSNNIIYHYGYPSIEDIFFLKTAKLFGYKIVYDIVENITYYDQAGGSLRSKFKNWSSRKMLKQLYKNGTLCFGISSGLVTFLNEICKGKIPVQHLPICIDIDYVNSFKKNEILNASRGSIKFFYGGSFGFKDGFEFLLRGFELACETNSNIELILTGKVSKQMGDSVHLLISSSKWSQKINFLGCLPEAEYYAELLNSDVLCMCRINSAYANFGFPFKLGEYLASGKAVIATDVSDISHYLVNMESALIIKPESAKEICNSILLLSKEPDLRLRLGNAAYNSAIKHFSSKKVGEMLLNSLKNI